MKQVSAEYKKQIKEMGREIDSIITYYNHYQIITENNKYILTEDGKKILTEQIKEESTTNITASDIYSSKVITHGDLLKTMMKEFDFEVKQDIKIGSIVSYQFGLKVNGSYEYVDYGKFIVNKKEYNEDTKTYSYVSYDKMLFTMIPYVAEDISERQGVYTLYDLVNYCCEFSGLQLGVESFPNDEREITNDTLLLLDESNFTFRDVLDYATEVTGCSSYLIDDNFVIMPPQETNEILSQDYTQLDYIESTGTQYIDTGYVINTNCSAKYGFMITGTVSDGHAIAGVYNGNNDLYFGIARSSNSKLSYRYKHTFYASNTTIIKNTLYDVETSLKKSNQFLKLNNIEEVNSSLNDDFTNDLTSFIFRVNQLNINYMIGRIYYFKIYDNDVLVRDFIPCKRNSDNEVGLYDLVNGVFYTNQGTGSFTYGNVVINPLTLYADSFKDNNVKFNEVFGPINSILFSRSEDTDVIEMKDDESIEANGVTQIKIKDNPFLEGNDRADYFEEMFDVLNGLSYSLNDVSSTGITYLEFNDKYKVSIDENEYDCLLLNDEINVVQGLEETIFTEEPQEKQQEYVTSTANVDDVSLRVDKANKQIVLKVDSNGNLATAELKQNADNGTAFHVKADDISLEGKTINLTGEDITIASTNFNVDTDGNITCNNATMNNANVVGGAISLTGDASTSPKFIIYSSTSNNNKIEFMPNLAKFYKNGIELIQFATYMTTPFIAVGNYDAIGQVSILQPDGVHTQSDIRLKENINYINEENSIKFITSLNPIEYTFKNDELYHKGLSAQEVEEKSKEQKTKIFSKDKNGYYNLNYVELIPDLINCIKYQQKEIEELKERIGK